MIDGRVCRRVREKGCGRSVLLSLLDVLICAGLISIAAEGSRCFGFGLRRVFPAEMILNLRRQAYEARLWVIKMSSRIKIKRLERCHSICYLRGALQLRSNHGYPCLCGGGLPAVAFSATSQTRPGSRRSSPATRRLQAEAAPAQIGSTRSAVLDCPPPAVGGLVRSPDHRQAGDRGFLASCRIPAVLAVAVQASRPARPQLNAQIRQLIRRMKTANPTWGAPR